MTIEATFNGLISRFSTLREAIEGLRLTVVEDRPSGDDVLLFERMSNLIDDLNGWLEEGRAGALRAFKAVTHPLNGQHAIQALAATHERLLQLEYHFFLKLTAYSLLDDLTRLSKSRGREWRAWNASVTDALDETSHRINELDRALLAAWQELAERIGTSGLSVQTTNIGPLISDRQREEIGNRES